MIELLLSAETSKCKSGGPRIADRAALTDILFMLKCGILRELRRVWESSDRHFRVQRRLKALINFRSEFILNSSLVH